MLKATILVFLGGGLGSLCRYLISLIINNTSIPLSTLVSNVLSCLILGVLIGLNSKIIIPDPTRLLLVTGFCGGFSTFSTFSGELVGMLQNADWKLALFYTCLKLFAGIFSVLTGIFLVRFMA